MVAVRNDKTPVLIGQEDDAQYDKPRPINPYYEPVFFAIIAHSDPLRAKKIRMHMGMSPKEGEKHREVGVFRASFDHWHCVLNWTPFQQGRVPPCHILVEFADEEVGILSPFADGGLIDGKPARNEWWGRFVQPRDLWKACTQAIPQKTGKDRKFQEFEGDVLDEEDKQEKEDVPMKKAVG